MLSNTVVTEDNATSRSKLSQRAVNCLWSRRRFALVVTAVERSERTLIWLDMDSSNGLRTHLGNDGVTVATTRREPFETRHQFVGEHDSTLATPLDYFDVVTTEVVEEPYHPADRL